MRLEKLAKLAFRFPSNVQPLERRLQGGLVDGRKRQSGYNVSFSEVRRDLEGVSEFLTLFSHRDTLEDPGIQISRTNVSSRNRCRIS